VRGTNQTVNKGNATWTAAEWEITSADVADCTPGTKDNDQSLPVELSSFTAKSVNSSIQLLWTTESETENLGFVIARKTADDKEWKEIASYINNQTLCGHGSTSKQNTYTYTDSKVIPGIEYEYLLKDVSYDGKIAENGTVKAIAKDNEANNIAEGFVLHPAYPNPFNPATSMKLNISESAIIKLQVYNITGELVNTLNNSRLNSGVHSFTWNANDQQGVQVSSGVYFIHMTVDNKQTSLQKVLLVR